jgi:starch phosphorylase
MKTRSIDHPSSEFAAGPLGPAVRTGLGQEAIAAAIADYLHYQQGVSSRDASRHDLYMALALTVRDRLLDRYLKTIDAVLDSRVKVVAYLSAEFLTGPHLGNHLLNLGIREAAAQALSGFGQTLEDVLEEEEEPGLGNGGLGRLAACYMDSLATLGVPAIGYGIRYEFGIFDQAIRDGWQVEMTDKWLRLGNPWEIPRPERHAYDVKFGGRTEHCRDEHGRYRVRWIPERCVKGVAYDTPVSGFGMPTANLLRLWRAEATESFDFDAFNLGDYYGAVDQKVMSETITKVLYPNDEPEAGKRLRLAQQFFFVSCSLQDMIRQQLATGGPLQDFASCWAVQLNDTHPSIAIAELMRLLVDEHDLDWEAAWRITEASCGYTNHTLMAEALERWPVALFRELLPRHLEIVHEINRRFLEDVRRRVPGDEDLVRRLSLIDEQGEGHVRMAHLASAGSHAINGVAALHSDLLKETVLRDFYTVAPQKFLNVTNGVTPRRWIALSNPGLTALLTRTIGDGWMSDLESRLTQVEPFAGDSGFRAEWRAVKTANKSRLAALIRHRTGIVVDPDSLFDVQVKRLHEYKRQHLNVLYLITEYNRIVRGAGGRDQAQPRTVVFGGKAAPGYRMAKLIIRLIHGVADVVNRDRRASELLKVVFFPDFNVKNGQHIYPAADLSEQISTAGKEASGTGNMKFAMNGALTIGTLDGANIEIRDAVGPENFFLFGLNAAEVAATKAAGYRPRGLYEANPELREAIDLIAAGEFSNGDRELFRPLLESLLIRDEYLLFADYQPYIDCQQRVSEAYRDQENWTRMSILNCARVGRFSSDRSIREYCRDIWHVEPVAAGRGAE